VSNLSRVTGADIVSLPGFEPGTFGSRSRCYRVARWRCGRTLGFRPTGGRWPVGSIPSWPVTKCRSTADHRVAAVGKLFTLIALAGVVAVHNGFMAAVRYGADL